MVAVPAGVVVAGYLEPEVGPAAVPCAPGTLVRASSYVAVCPGSSTPARGAKHPAISLNDTRKRTRKVAVSDNTESGPGPHPLRGRCRPRRGAACA